MVPGCADNALFTLSRTPVSLCASHCSERYRYCAVAFALVEMTVQLERGHYFNDHNHALEKVHL